MLSGKITIIIKSERVCISRYKTVNWHTSVGYAIRFSGYSDFICAIIKQKLLNIQKSLLKNIFTLLYKHQYVLKIY